MALSELIAQTIAQHIANPKVISYSPTKLNEVHGRFVSSNRVYNFVLTPKGVSYSPAGQGDSLLFSGLFLERLDAVRKSKIGNDKCNAGKSYQCGKICLGNRRKCHKGVRDVNDARRIASILESTNQKLAGDVSGEISKKARDRGLDLFAARSRRKREGKPQRPLPIPKGKSIADIPNIPESAKPWVKSVENLATPELVEIAGKVGIPEVTTGKSRAGAFYTASSNTIAMGSHIDQNVRGKIVFLHEYGHYIDFNLGKEGNKLSPVSASEEGVKARKLDEKILKDTQPKAIYEGIKIDNDKTILKAIKDSKSVLSSGLNPDHQIFDMSKNVYETSKSLVVESIKKGLSMSPLERATFKQALYNVESLSAKDLTGDPVYQAKQLDPSVSIMVQDLFGSITKNKVGRGHSDNYYKTNKGSQGKEAFANIIAIANSGDEKAISIAKKFAPNMWKFVMDSIKV
jgi:hypothetical protein